MRAETSSHLGSPRRDARRSAPLRAFDGLQVRPKLIILHNVFFAVLAVSVYFSSIPLLSNQLGATRDREHRLYERMFREGLLTADQAKLDSKIYALQLGSATQLGLSAEGRSFLLNDPTEIWRQQSDTVFRKSGAAADQFERLKISFDEYDTSLHRARLSLFVVLGTIYVLSIFFLEFIIMPQYVYGPIRLMLEADRATQSGDRENELIDPRFITKDEIGRIMQSRNSTVIELRRQEDDLANALQKIEEQDRLVSLGLLSTSVAHELNTPLAVLQGSIEKLLETEKDRHTLDRLARMLRVTQRLRKISEGLVDFARLRTKETEAVYLRPIVEESWTLVAIDEKASAVSFYNDIGEADAVPGNADRLVQVFVNLLRNALLAVPNEGEIRVESKSFVRGSQEWICCTVLDNGPGIPSHVLNNLFKAFVTTRLDSRGTGLGLTVAEGIVTQHGGSITADNRPSGGAALRVVLPKANAPSLG
ncbi:MAG: sensor histidine kinase [Bryobacteraceae bacterium]